MSCNGTTAVPPEITLLTGGIAGLFEALCCHPLDTIKVRMQIYRNAKHKAVKVPGLIETVSDIYSKEGLSAFYNGLSAVVLGITPKMAIRFSSYEFYKKLLTKKNTDSISTSNIFVAGVGAGITEAVFALSPMEIIKIRLQTNRVSSDVVAGQGAKYRNVFQTGYAIVKEEGIRGLYKGLSLTAARQATNQGTNFTVYSKLKEYLQNHQNLDVLPSWQTSIVGLISGFVGPFFNAPLDTIKTRLQNSSGKKLSGWTGITTICNQLIQEDGFRAFYKGITSRVIRVAPGQAVTFTVYEFVLKHIQSMRLINYST